MDGARLWHAAIALSSGDTGSGSGTLSTPENALRTLGRLGTTTTTTVCLSKGMGAPIGSLLIGPLSFIREARRVRKRLGGGMRQVGVVAAMALYALDNHWSDFLIQDHERARYLAEQIRDRLGFPLLLQDSNRITNIVFLNCLTI